MERLNTWIQLCAELDAARSAELEARDSMPAPFAAAPEDREAVDRWLGSWQRLDDVTRRMLEFARTLGQ